MIYNIGFPCVGHPTKQIIDDNGSDNDSVLNDAASIVSIYSNASHPNARYDLDDGILSGQQSPDYCEEDVNGTIVGNEDGVAHFDDFASKLSMVLEELQSTKSQKDRLRHYDSLVKAFQTRYLGDDYLDNR